MAKNTASDYKDLTYISKGIQTDGPYLINETVTTPTDTSSYVLYKDSSHDLYWWNGSSSVKLNSTGGTGTGSMDDAYSIGRDVAVDEGAVVWTDTAAGALNTMEFVKSGAGSGNVLDFSIDAALTGSVIAMDMNLGIAAPAISIDAGATARTGSDLAVNDDSTGNHSVIDINKSGSGASIGLDYQESYNGSSTSFAVKVTLDNADGIDTTAMQVVRGTGVRTVPVIDINDASTGSAHILDVDLTGVYTGNVFDFASAAAATGNVINMNLDNAVAMTGLHIEGSGVRTQPMVEIITDSTSSASLIDISVDGAITGTAAIDIDMNAGLAANALYIDAGAGTRTADEIAVKHDGDGNVDVMSVVSTNTGTGSIFDINMDAAGSTSGVFNIDMNAALGAPVMVLDAGAGTRTADMIDVTFDGDGNVGFLDLNCTNTGSGDLIDIDVTGIHTGDVIDITYGTAASTGDAIKVAMGTNLAGSALSITRTGVVADDSIKIVTDQTGSAHQIDMTITGAAYTGSGLNILHQGDGYAIDITGDLAAASQSVARITATSTTGAVTCLELDQDDIDIGFITFTGTEGSGNSIDTDDKSGGVAKYAKVDVNGSAYYLTLTPGA